MESIIPCSVPDNNISAFPHLAEGKVASLEGFAHCIKAKGYHWYLCNGGTD
jgi:hypothetical protein